MNGPDFSRDLENLSPTRREALNSPPTLVGKGAGGLGFPHDLNCQMNGHPLILVVEQSLHDLELLNSHLGILNFSCICTKQGVRAVTLAQTHQPDLILLDMMLSNLSANRVIDDLKHDSKTATIPIIAVTPLTMAQHHDSTMLTGFDDCITKPYDFNQLEVVINRHISQLNS